MSTTITTATITASKTLTARVRVLGEKYGRYEVEVITGTGGWNKPGKVILAQQSMLSDIRVEEAAEQAAPAEAAPVAADTQQDAPAPVESPEIAAARAELERLSTALANFQLHGGRGKQGKIRYDGGLRRMAKLADQVRSAQARLQALERAHAAGPVAPVTAEALRGAIAVRDRYGWHRVVRVNAKSVTVETGYSWTDRLPIEKIIGFR